MVRHQEEAESLSGIFIPAQLSLPVTLQLEMRDIPLCNSFKRKQSSHSGRFGPEQKALGIYMRGSDIHVKPGRKTRSQAT